MLYRDGAIEKLEGTETDDGLRVDVPLVVTEEASPGTRPNMLHSAEENVDWRVTAPLQLVLVGMDEIEETASIAGTDAVKPGVVTYRNVLHSPFIGRHGDAITITCTNMRHIHA